MVFRKIIVIYQILMINNTNSEKPIQTYSSITIKQSSYLIHQHFRGDYSSNL